MALLCKNSIVKSVDGYLGRCVLNVAYFEIGFVFHILRLFPCMRVGSLPINQDYVLWLGTRLALFCTIFVGGCK